MRVGLVSVLVVSLVACRETSVASTPAPDASASASTSATATAASVPEAGPALDASSALDVARTRDAASARPVATVDSGGAVQAPTRSAAGFGKHGDVCAYGARSGPHLDAPPPCGPGLFCCYPCGIEGCDSVCHTESECNADRTRP